jgi:hypothetical protein
MKWKNAVRDHLPEPSSKVLVSLRGVYYMAIYDGDRHVFRIRDDDKDLELSESNDQLYWTEINNSN